MKVSKAKFFAFISNQYRVSSYEEFPPEYSSKYYISHMTYALRVRERFYMAIKYALKHLRVPDSKVLDLGVYPGTLIRLLTQYLPDSKLKFFGAGLGIDSKFIDFMKKETGAAIKIVNLDPKSKALSEKNYPTRIPIEDKSIDFVFALEIIEHLTSPFHLLSEANRVLKKGGYILLTTPNVSRIGSIFKLLIGKTNFDRLKALEVIDTENHWHSHFREYTMEELTNLLQRTGFKIEDKVFFYR